MLDDLVVQILGEKAFGRLGRSRRAQLLVRLFFGALGSCLGVVGAVHFARTAATSNVAMRASVIAMFLALACVSLCNVGLRRKWKWPSLDFVAAFVSMFVTRLALGP